MREAIRIAKHYAGCNEIRPDRNIALIAASLQDFNRIRVKVIKMLYYIEAVAHHTVIQRSR